LEKLANVPVSPALAEHLAADMVDAYAEAERQMLARMAKRLAKGIDGPAWAEAKLFQIQAYKRECELLLSDLEAKARTGVETAITKAYEQGGMAAIDDIARLKPGVVPVEPLAGLRAVEALTAETLANLTATHRGAVTYVTNGMRTVIDEATRATVERAGAQVLLGTQTRRQAAQSALDRFARAGVRGFIDKAGRGWTLESYTEMALRTGCGRAAVQGAEDRLTANDIDLVIVSDAPKECPLCRPWEGKVLSLGSVKGEGAVAKQTQSPLTAVPQTSSGKAPWMISDEELEHIAIRDAVVKPKIVGSAAPETGRRYWHVASPRHNDGEPLLSADELTSRGTKTKNKWETDYDTWNISLHDNWEAAAQMQKELYSGRGKLLNVDVPEGALLKRNSEGYAVIAREIPEDWVSRGWTHKQWKAWAKEYPEEAKKLAKKKSKIPKQAKVESVSLDDVGDELGLWKGPATRRSLQAFAAERLPANPTKTDYIRIVREFMSRTEE